MSVTRALGDENILHVLLSVCGKAEIASLRLTCRIFEKVGSIYLFESLTIGFSKRYLRRLARVADQEKFAKGVRQIVWEANLYDGGEVPYGISDVLYGLLLEGHFSPNNYDTLLSSLKVAENRVRAMEKGRHMLSPPLTTANRPWLQGLVSSLRELNGIRSIVFTYWSPDRGVVLDKGALLGESSDRMPPPVRIFQGPDSILTNLTCEFAFLLRSIGRLGWLPDGLEVSRSAQEQLGTISRDWPVPYRIVVPGMLLQWELLPEGLVQATKKCLARLRRLHLDLSVEEYGQNVAPGTRALLDNGKFPDIFANFEHLEDLYLRAASTQTGGVLWGTEIIRLETILGEKQSCSLRKLHLSDFWLESQELCTMLEVHGASLEEVRLSRINLGQAVSHTEKAAAPEKITWLPPPVDTVPVHLTLSPTSSDWRQVVQSCQELSRLKGLLIETPSFVPALGDSWIYVS